MNAAVRARLQRLAWLHERAIEVGVGAPDLLYLLCLCAPGSITRDLVARAVAWRPPDAPGTWPSALERPADESWQLLLDWREEHLDARSADSRDRLVWILQTATAEDPELWAGEHPSTVVMAWETIGQGAAAAARALGLHAADARSLDALLREAGTLEPTQLLGELPLLQPFTAVLLGRPWRALAMLLEEGADRAALADVLRRLGLVEDATHELSRVARADPLGRRVAAMIALDRGDVWEELTGGDLGLQLLLALAAPVEDADRTLAHMREAPGPWELVDQWRFSGAASALALRGHMGLAWGLVRKDAAGWKSRDRVLSALWHRLVRRTRATPEDLREWIDRCPV